jgi:DNA primase
MSGIIPEEIIYRVKQAADIVDVISRYVPLKKAGHDYKACCPFHREEHPSFTVSPSKRLFRCFGCHEGGDVFAFIMKYQTMNFYEAVRYLAEHYGIHIPTTDAKQGENAVAEKALREKLFNINALAARYYQEMLGSEKGAAVRSYLKKRGLTQELEREFALGYAPDGWDCLLTFLRSRQVPLQLMEKTGLIIPRSGGGYYDRFRSRVIFPIHDLNGHITGLGGRSLDDSLPKYLNSPETPIYHKGRSLYGLNRAQSPCRSQGLVILVEGYMDLLALYAHGVKNVVAALGTALTPEQVRLMKRTCSRIVLGFDSDEAGEKAVLRNAPLLLREGIHGSVVVLSPGDDPDDFINREGADSFLQKIESAPSLIDFCLETLLRKGTETIPQQLMVIEGFKPIYGAIGTEIEKSTSVKMLSERLGQDEIVVSRSLASTQHPPKSAPWTNPGRSSFGERFVLGFFLHHQECGHELMKAGLPDLLEDQSLALLLKDALEDYRQNGSVDVDRLMLRHNDPQIHKLLAEIVFSNEEIGDTNTEIILCDILNKFKQKSLKQKALKLKNQIAEAEKQNDQELLQALLAEKKELIKQQAMKL